MRATTLLGLALLCAAISGCGLSGGGSGPNSRDRIPDALRCLHEDKGLAARLEGRDSIQVGDPTRGPRIRFFLTGGEASAAQFEGREEGTEQIGASLLYVRQADDHTLADVENCLDNL
ncbi:MAG: hypothetical protein ABR581_08310 [Thermoleophilaceae bacterium]